MKTGIYSSLILTVALVVLGAACQPSSNVNTNSSMNQNMMNRNSMMMNGNMMNGNSMSMNSNSAMSSDPNHGMSDMMGKMKSDPNAASAPYDLQFLDTMSAHHQSAIEMAEMALKKSQNAELKTFAQKIITDQKKEIALMKDWREKWYAGKPAAKNMEMPGMMDSMKMMAGGEMKKMEDATGKEFDLMFLGMMSPHHAGATVMAKEALTKAEHPEIKTLANQIIKAQEAEIKQMADWKAKWSK
ncbi:MAG TPA: DUF305 domain-containing protein [Pyrinomonadaceae bacterium]|nr:DUF305 domain-containing protein [Pyrinomonadaceae bacterium]